MISFFKKTFIRIIEVIEQKFNLHFLTYAQHGTWSLLSHITSVLFALVTSYFFAHYFSQEQYGTYKYILSLSGILGAFTLTGMNTAITRTVAAGNDGAYLPSIRYQLRWNGVLFLVSFIPITFFALSGNTTVALGFGIVSIATVFLTTFNTYAAYLNGKKQFKLLAQYNVLTALAQAITVTLAIVFLKNTLWVLTLLFGIQTLMAILFHFRIRSRFPKIANQIPAGETIRFGKILSMNNIIKLLSDQADKFIMFIFFGPGQLAIYAFAQAMPDQIRGIFKIVPPVVLPHLAGRNTHEIPKTFWRYLGVLSLVAIGAVIIYNIFAQLVFTVLFDTYLASIPYSRILSLSMIPIVLTLPLGTFINARGNARASRMLSTATACIEIGTLIIGGYFFGFLGMVIGKVISATGTFCVALFLVKRYHPIVPPILND